jgi:hypothetical protein
MTGNDANAANDQQLREWAQRVKQALQLLDIKIEPDEVAGLAARADAAAGPGAGNIGVFLAGYAAGGASTEGTKSAREALDAAIATVDRLCADGATSGPDRGGWAATGQ